MFRSIFILNFIILTSSLFSQSFNYDVFVGERLTFSIPKYNQSDYFGIESKPQTAYFDTITGAFQWSPVTNEIGYHLVVYNIFKSSGELIETNKFSIHVIQKIQNKIPEILINECTTNGAPSIVFKSKDIYIQECDTLFLSVDIQDDEDVFTSYYFNGDLNTKSVPNADILIEDNYKRLELKYIPNENDARNKNLYFHIVTRDNAGGTLTKIFRIVIKNINFPPLIVNKPLNSRYIFDDGSFLYTPQKENDDNQKLLWKIQCDNSLLEYLVFDNNTGSVSIKINNNLVRRDSIDYSFTIFVKEEKADRFSDSVHVVCKWQKSNIAPYFVNLEQWELKEGIKGTYQIHAIDPNINDVISYKISSVNFSGLSIDEKSGTICFMPSYDLVTPNEKSKEFKVSVTISDSRGLSTTSNLGIKVYDRYDPDNIKTKYMNYKTNLVDIKSSCDEMYNNLNEIRDFLELREKRLNYVLSSLTIIGAAGVLFVDGSTGKNIATIAAGVPAAIKVYKELNSKTDDETEDLIDDVVKQQSLLAYRIDNLESRFTSNPGEKEFEDHENINYIIYMIENELPSLHSSHYYLFNKYLQLTSTGKHKKVMEKIKKRKAKGASIKSKKIIRNFFKE